MTQFEEFYLIIFLSAISARDASQSVPNATNGPILIAYLIYEFICEKYSFSFPSHMLRNRCHCGSIGDSSFYFQYRIWKPRC
jgi:hypothetical protein